MLLISRIVAIQKKKKRNKSNENNKTMYRISSSVWWIKRNKIKLSNQTKEMAFKIDFLMQKLLHLVYVYHFLSNWVKSEFNVKRITSI